MMLNKPAHITSLATSCILISIDNPVWTATKQDGETSGEITRNKKASHDAGRFTQHLLAGNLKHKAILNKRQAIDTWKKALTYPWSGRMSLLPTVDLPKFMKEYAIHEQEFNKLKDDFLADYQSEVSNMAFKMGDLFNKNNYPDVATIQSKFSIKLYTAEVPQGDFRVQMSEELASDLQHQFEREATNNINNIMEEQASRLIDVMESLSASCEVVEELDKDGKLKIRRRKLYDSTLQKAVDLCRVFENFNLTNNPDLEQTRSKLQNLLSGINLDALRDSDSLRGKVKDEVDGILKMFKGS